MFLSILFSIFLTTILPIGFFVYMHKKHGFYVTPYRYGIAGFGLAIFFESILHTIVLHPDSSGAVPLMSVPIAYMLYAGFMAGIFEETSRFILLKLFARNRKKYSNVKTGISYGLGHGTAESIMIVGFGMVSYLLIYLGMKNVSSLQSLVNEYNTETILSILLGGFERIPAIAIHIALSVIVFYSVFSKGKWFLYPIAIILHALNDFPAALHQVGVIHSIYTVVILAFIGAVIMCLISFGIHKKYKHTLANII